MPPIEKALNFKIRVDQASAQQANAAAGALIERLQSLQSETRRLRIGSEQLSASWRTLGGSTGAREALTDAKRAASQFRIELDKVGTSVEDVDTALKHADGASSYKSRLEQASKREIQLQSVGRQGRQVTGLIGALGGGEIATKLNLGAEVLEAVGGVKELKNQLPALVQQLDLTSGKIALLAVSVAAGAAAFLIARDQINEWRDAATEARQQIEGQIGALKNYYDLIGDATSGDVKARIDEVAQRRALNGQMLEDLMELKLAVEGGLDVSNQGALEQLSEGAVRVAESIGVTNLGTESLDKAIQETNTAMRENEIEFSMLTQAYTDGTTAINDAARRAEEASVRQVAGLERETQLRIQAGQITAEQVDDRVAQIGRERAAYQTLIAELEMLSPESEAAAQKLSEVRDTIATLDQELAVLTGSSTQAAYAQAALDNILGLVTQGAEKVTEAVTGTGAAFDEAADRAQAFNDAQAGVNADRALKTQREQEDFERKRLQDLADHYADMADLDVEYLDDRADLLDDIAEDLQDIDKERIDAIKDYNKESRRMAQDHKDAILQIQRETNYDYQDAARARDTAGALAALRNGERRIEDEQRSYTKEQDRREEDIKDQIAQLESERREELEAGRQALRDLEQQHRKERASKAAAFRQQLQREDEQRQIAAQRQQADWNREDQARRDHYGVIETATSTHYSSLHGRLVTAAANIEAAWGTLLGNLVASIAGSTGSAAPRLPGTGYVPEEFAAGGTPPLFRRVTIGETRPETAVFASGRRQIVGSHGRESALFTEPVRIYPSAEAGMGINVNVGGIRIQAQGSSARAVAQKLSQADFNAYLAKAVNDYVRGA